MKVQTKKGAIGPIFLVTLFLFSLIALAVLLQGRVSFLNFAANNKIPFVRGLANDFTADLVLGQPDFNQAIPGTVSSDKVAHPGGVYVDKSVSPNRVYIYDGLNSRMLGYKSLGNCKVSAMACTSDSDCDSTDSCEINRLGPGGNKKPDIIIGQPNDFSSACNGDGTNNLSTDFPLPTASTLCGVPPSEPSPAEGGSWESPATDREGNLYMADFYNNRVLKYNDPFKTDQVADEVWGQPDFASYKCNRGGSISNSGFCFINNAPVKPVVGGVDIDSKGNLWVVDGGNNRVLRFPKVGSSIKKEADLVIGQQDFVSKSGGSGLDKFNAPTVVRVNSSGTVYVADAQNGRVVFFPSPVTTGMTGKLLSGTSAKAGGIEFDIKKDSDPSSGGIWVGETDNHQIALFSESGQVKKVLLKDTYRPNGTFEGQTNCPTQGDSDLCSLEAPRGSIGVTKDGDVIASGSYAESALYFKNPIPTPTPGTSYQAIRRFFAPPFTANSFDSKSFLGPRGLATTKDQLIVSDHARILFWNNLTPTSPNINRPADGVLMAPNATTYLDPYFFRIFASDKSLWVIYQNSLLRFTLPLKNGQPYAQRIQFSDLRYINNNNPVGFETYASDVYAAPDDEYLWLTFPYQNRVARVIVPPDYQGDFKIDTLIGGETIPKNNHVWHQACPENLNEPCSPGSVVEDTNGNLVVSDYYIENEGTGDLFFFKNDLFPLDENLKVKSIKDNFKKFPRIFGWQPAFGPNNEMIIGTAAFFNGVLRFPTVYADPTKTMELKKIASLTENYTQALTTHFDSQWNLFITDMNRGRVLAYLKPIKKVTSERPIAQFTFTPHLGKSPLVVKFTNTSPVPNNDKLKSFWDFGDGTRSTETNPTHTFKTTGYDNSKTFTVQLIVTNSKKEASLPKTKVVTVQSRPQKN